MNDLASDSEGKQGKQPSFFPVLFCGLKHRVWPRFSVGLLTSSDTGFFPPQIIQSRKVPHRCAQLLGFQSTPDVVLLTTRISHHSLSFFCQWLISHCVLGSSLCYLLSFIPHMLPHLPSPRPWSFRMLLFCLGTVFTESHPIIHVIDPLDPARKVPPQLLVRTHLGVCFSGLPVCFSSERSYIPPIVLFPLLRKPLTHTPNSFK